MYYDELKELAADSIQLTITARMALDKGFWEELCKLRGWSPYIVNEGLMPANEKIELTPLETKTFGRFFNL